MKIHFIDNTLRIDIGNTLFDSNRISILISPLRACDIEVMLIHYGKVFFHRGRVDPKKHNSLTGYVKQLLELPDVETMFEFDPHYISDFKFVLSAFKQAMKQLTEPFKSTIGRDLLQP